MSLVLSWSKGAAPSNYSRKYSSSPRTRASNTSRIRGVVFRSSCITTHISMGKLKASGRMGVSSIAAARATGARILLPGNVYNFDPGSDPVVTETTPERPVSRKGELRVAMERRLRESDVKALIVRAGDFYGPGASANSWFGQMVKPGRLVRRAVYPGQRGVGHTWAYLPDLAETMVRLAEREADLEPHAVFNFGGTWFERGEDMARAILRVAEQPERRIGSFPWPVVVALSPFVRLFREILEMRYLWRQPLKLDNSKLVAFLGAEPKTPLDCSVALALEAMGCLEPEWPVVAECRASESDYAVA